MGDVFKIKFILQDKSEFEKKIAFDQLNEMIRFSESYSCRRKPLLEYFGEKYSKSNCGMCDNCLTIPREQSDITIPAQKFLSCVKRTDEKFNIWLEETKKRGELVKQKDEIGDFKIGVFQSMLLCAISGSNGYKKELSLDKINNYKNYSPKNCRYKKYNF
jgi:ATP-dependent DNA helicase RecQ